MKFNDERSPNDRAYRSAVRRFPEAELSIRRLMLRDETFRDICEELAVAEDALLTLPKALSMLSENRKREFQELVDRLVAEMKSVLTDSEQKVAKSMPPRWKEK